MRTSVNTEELRVQADQLLRLKADVEGAQHQVRQQLNMLEEQTIPEEKEDLRRAIRQLQDTLDSIDDLQRDLLKIADIYENTDSDVNRMIRALPTGGDILPSVRPGYRQQSVDYVLNVVRYAEIVHYITSGQVHMLQYTDFLRPIGKWTDKKYFMVPETVLRVDDWLKYRLMEAYAHEHI